MNRQNGPVIFVALYVMALIFTWISLFSIERFGETEFKAWAPVIQAVLSAGAIFSAWLLQDLKRKADRKEAERDTLLNIRTVTRLLEDHMAHAISVTLAGRLTARVATSLRSTSVELEGMLRQMNLAHLPDEKTVDAVASMLVRAANFSGMLGIATTATENVKVEVADVFKRAYGNYYSGRTRFLENCGFSPEAHRTTKDDIKPIEQASEIAS